MKIIDNSAKLERSTLPGGSELLIGCGRSRKKQISIDKNLEWKELVTLDIDPDCGADVLHDLNNLPLPFSNGSFDEIHAYEVLEHVGQQGDWKAFFDIFAEFHRILRPDGLIVGSTPMWDSIWAWGDPGHTRVINEGTLIFLDQDTYDVDSEESPLTDYRHYYKADFKVRHTQEVGERFCFVLQKK